MQQEQQNKQSHEAPSRKTTPQNLVEYSPEEVTRFLEMERQMEECESDRERWYEEVARRRTARQTPYEFRPFPPGPGFNREQMRELRDFQKLRNDEVMAGRNPRPMLEARAALARPQQSENPRAGRD